MQYIYKIMIVKTTKETKIKPIRASGTNILSAIAKSPKI